MNLKTTALIGITVVGLAVGGAQLLDPTNNPDEQRRQQQVQDAADADQRNKDRMRDDGNSHVDSENDRKLKPGEHRPPEKPRIKIRIRIP